MSDKPIEPFDVMQEVEQWVDKQFLDAAKFTNSHPLDSSSVYTLHDLAASIYAMGWRQGHLAGSDAQHRQARRDREHAPPTATTAAASEDGDGGAS